MTFFIILLILAIGGRWACSRICPLGILEELIFKIPFLKKYIELPHDQHWKKIKYLIFFPAFGFDSNVFPAKSGKLESRISVFEAVWVYKHFPSISLGLPSVL